MYFIYGGGGGGLNYNIENTKRINNPLYTYTSKQTENQTIKDLMHIYSVRGNVSVYTEEA